MAGGPLQIVLNADDFRVVPEVNGGGRDKDFFAERDDDYRAHKRQLKNQVASLRQALEANQYSSVGFAKVVLRRSALAKSHRPVRALFKPARTPVVGGGDLGEILIEANPQSLRQIEAEIESTEDATNMQRVPATGKFTPKPSRQRSEVGAIDRVQLYGPRDKREFSVEQAISWLSKPRTGGAYHVDLFEDIPPRAQWDTLSQDKRKLCQSFVDGLLSLGTGLRAEATRLQQPKKPTLLLRLERSVESAVVQLLPSSASPRGTEIVPFDESLQKHTTLLNFLDNHPLVRKIRLPGVIVRSALAPRTRPGSADLPEKDANFQYPRIGIIDGGVSEGLADWTVGRWDTLADVDQDQDHGTFIGGLIVGGQAWNGPIVCPETDGAELIDIAVLPPEDRFDSYYPKGSADFFEEVSNAVQECRARFGARVFNFSINVESPVATDRYSAEAIKLDEIAEANDALIVISAGNLKNPNLRAEWPAEPTDALTQLASMRNDGLFIPAESVRNVSVGALNVPDVGSSIAHAPARYSRRGPGLRSGVKPDLSHYGGTGTSVRTMGTGLFSIAPDGSCIDGCGTSYATPLVAKTAALLDQAIEGGVSRETLTALLIHGAALPEPLQHKLLRGVARHLAGFGVPAASAEILEAGDHQITLVFASRLYARQELRFNFSWPPSLVGLGGKCKGATKLTLVASPPLDSRYGAEFVRFNIDAHLRQEQEDGSWRGELQAAYLPYEGDHPAYEAELIEHGLKWSPIKTYARVSKRGIGKSSNWRLVVDYLERAGETIPDQGIPFTAILTIEDPDQDKPIFNEMRQNLQAGGVRISDIRTAARITPRV